MPLVREARLLSSVDAYYPDAARRAQVNGVVDVAIVIDVHGRVERARAVEGHPMLRMAAEDAVRRWRFEPATADGVPTVSHKRVRISFK